MKKARSSNSFRTVKLYSALRIATVYFIFSVLWIFLSDKLLDKVVNSWAEASFFQTMKGCFFIGISTYIIYALVRYQLQKQKNVFEHYLQKSEQLTKVVKNLPNVLLLLFDAHGQVLLREGKSSTLHSFKKQLFPSGTLTNYTQTELNQVFKGTRMVKEFELDKHTYEWSTELLNPNNPKNGAIAVIVDITERKNTEANLVKAKKQAEESETLKSAFLANLSHEVRTPLNSIMGFSELIAQFGEKNEDTAHFADIIRNSCDDLTDIVDNLMEVSRIQVGQLKAENTLFSVNELMRDIKYMTNSSGVEIRVALSRADEEDCIISDQRKIQQVLQKLVNNALKFTLSGYVALGYEIEEDAILFSVKDTGLGIPDDKKNVVFEPFRQADNSNTRKHGGAGLGLTIAKGLVESLNGEIWFETAIGKGTSFFFRIPIKYNALNGVKGLEDELGEFTGLHVLLVDEDVDNQEVIKALLQPLGIKISTLAKAEEAIDYCLEHKPDMALIEVQLHGMNGFELAKQLKLHCGDIKTIAQTAFKLSELQRTDVKIYFDDYLPKPLEPKKLIQAIANQQQISR